jgi:hypothetical protein
VLPTRDLVIQVRETFEAVAKGRGLKVSGCLVPFLSFMTFPPSPDSLCNGPTFIFSRAVATCGKNAKVLIDLIDRCH